MTSRGFTLIELLLVMALAMLIIAGSWPMLSGFSRERVLAANANSVLAMVNTARTAAVENASVCRMEVDSTDKLCKLLLLSDGEYVELDRPVGMKLNLPDEIEIELEFLDSQQPYNYIAFSSNGSSEAVRITLENSSGDKKYVYSLGLLENFSVTSDYEDTKQ